MASIRKFFSSLYRKLLWKLMSTKFYSWVVLNVIPYIRFSTYYTQIKGWQYLRGYKLLKPGHIIFTVDKAKLTSVLIPGDFSHVAFCVDKLSEWEISEMTRKHYTRSTFFDICKESDRVVIMECTDFSPDYVQKMIFACKLLKNAKYDVRFAMEYKGKLRDSFKQYVEFLLENGHAPEDIPLAFSLGVEPLACSELIYESDFEKRIKVSAEDIAGLGAEYVSPEGLAKAPNMRVVWDSQEEERPEWDKHS